MSLKKDNKPKIRLKDLNTLKEDAKFLADAIEKKLLDKLIKDYSK